MASAMVGTVHSIGHQMLSRYALHSGLSPQLEPLEEKAQERHLRRILAEMPPPLALTTWLASLAGWVRRTRKTSF